MKALIPIFIGIAGLVLLGLIWYLVREAPDACPTALPWLNCTQDKK